MYPTASAPQYAFGPGLAPVPMPGMARGGLAALANQYRKGGKIKYFEEGGEGSGTGNDAGVSDSPGPDSGGADQSAEGGAGAGFSGPSETQSMAQAEIGNQAVTNALAEAAVTGVLGDQVTAEANEAEAENAANTAAALGAQANAIAAEAIANAEEDAKAAEMAAVMSGQVAGFPGPAPTPSFGFSLQSPFNLKGQPMSLTNNPVVNDFVTVNTPVGNFGVNALSLGSMGGSKAAQAANAAVGVGRAMGYAEGGVASLANQIQSKGRGQDTMLVHMTPGEVKGLQALAMSQGGSLTINPQTGLPEAGFLSKILPMVAGFALGPAGFGLMSSIQAGLTVGALTGVATGSLKKGLMAGLGAYGGAGIGEGLVNAATPMEAAQTGIVADPSLIDASATQFPTKDITFGQTPNFGVPSAPNVMPPDVASGRFVDDAIAKAGYTYDTAGGPLIKMTPDVMPPDVASGRFVDEGIAKAGYTYDPAGKSLIKTPVTGPVPGESGLNFSSSKNRFFDQLPPSNLPVQPTGLQGAGSGLKNMFDTGQVGTDARSAFMKATPTGSLTAAGTTVASALTPEPAPLPTSKSFIRGYDLDITNPSGTPMYTPQDTREREQVRYTYSPREIYEAAQGGLTALNGQTYDDEYGRDEYDEGGSVQKRKSRSLKGNPYYRFADSRRDSSMEAAIDQNFAKGGLGALPPRFLSGGGDGMSDSIKARIGGVQEARLADGEFVVPADVVSHLGNGSSKAGAKKLYAMMDKIRKARTGRTRQAPEVNARKYMPA
jgi:hypothetical protein